MTIPEWIDRRSGSPALWEDPMKDPLAYLDPFRQWAKNEPERLLAYLRDPESPPTRLTFAAEVAGRERGPGAQKALLALTHHASSVGARAIVAAWFAMALVES